MLLIYWWKEYVLGQQTRTFTEAVEQYAQFGLRTLCLAWRDLEEEEYHEWSLLFKEANSSLVDREVRNHHYGLCLLLLAFFLQRRLDHLRCVPSVLWTFCWVLHKFSIDWMIQYLCAAVESSWGLPKDRAWLWDYWSCSNWRSSTGDTAFFFFSYPGKACLPCWHNSCSYAKMFLLEL